MGGHVEPSEELKRLEEEASLRLQLVALKNRFDENEMAQSAAALEAGKRLFLFNRQVELADLIRILEGKLSALERPKK